MPASIGVVVPNYNYGRYLPERVASILAQERAPDSLVFLDDASTDESWAIAPGLLAGFAGRLATHRNAARSADVLHQWRAGLERLDTDLVWIAEADDRCAPGLLRALAARLESDPAARFAFCDSAAIDTDGARIADDTKAYYRVDGESLLEADSVFPAEEFLATCLVPKNMVVNASAVLWRREVLAAALDSLVPELGAWLNAGDWRTYAEACAAPGGTVHYLAAPLNEHRRHAASVTRATPPVRHYGEVVRMQAWLRGRLGPDAARDAAMRDHLAALRRAWHLVPAPLGEAEAA